MRDRTIFDVPPEPNSCISHYYEIEKKGIRFPNKIVFEEVYISAAKRYERSRTVIEYDNYRFFIVDYGVKYKGGGNEKY